MPVTRRVPGPLDIVSNHQRLVQEPSQDDQLAFFSTPPSPDDPASPPYRPQASRTDLRPDSHPSPSPSYRSAFMPGPAPSDEKGKHKASVHYPVNIDIPPGGTTHDHDHSVPQSAGSSVVGTDDEEDYDWSDEEDLVDEEAKFEKRMGNAPKRTGWGFKRIMTLLFSSLIGSTFLAAVLVTPGILIYFFWYKPSRTEYRHKITLNVQAWLFWAAANLLISWYLAMLINVVPSFVRFFLSAAWGHVSETIKSRIEMYNSVKDTIKPVFYAASCWASWVIIFSHIFQLYGTNSKNHQAYTETVFKVVEFFFFFTVVLCAQRMLSHMIAFAFHRTAFKDRVDAVEETLAVVEKLREYHPKQSHAHKRRSGLRTPLFGAFSLGTPAHDEDQFKFVSSKLKDHKRRTEHAEEHSNMLHVEEEPLNGSRPGSRPISMISDNDSPHTYPPSRGDREEATLVGTAARALKSTLLHDARNIKGKDATSGTDWNVNSANEAKHLARSIYMRLKSPSRNYLLPADFHPAFPTAEEAEAAFRVFDKDNNGDLSRAEVKTTLMKVYKERRFLARAMRDVGAALKTLDSMLLVVALIAQFFISLSVFGVNLTSSLTSVYTLSIGASFIFKTAASSAFDSIMFLFVTHPFDTGDRCFIDDEIMVVKKMELFATIFTRWDGTESYYFNSQLANKFITNVRRSGKMFESLTMQVAWRTPLAKLDALEAAVNTWLSTEQNRWFVPGTSVTLQHIDFQRYLEFTMGFGHNGTWQDWGLRSARKTAFHAAVQHYCRELGIVCYASPQPIVWGDPNLELPPYPPVTSPTSVTPASPDDLDADADAEGEDVVLESTAKLAPMLGFTPHKASPIHRARTRGKKAALRAAGGGGDM
ncbi:Mechanosensitive ion channel-domain-containing protein [Mycena alexandri]|uniref:Mechanosensitive ion channel-domain-containing protein n=1 Tax=Mycena alexandri TaxID=1745969 RepID=A0AAD6TKR1_9AGAR|nr:Mechanosensitive ion channel-domain-containing protein [Mycena alexandri]